MRFGWFIIFCMMSVCSFAYDVPRSLIDIYENKVLSPIEGVWLWNTGALVTITSRTDGTIALTLQRSPDPTVDTPVVIGYGRFGGKSGSYDIELITAADLNAKSGVKKTQKFIATLSDNGRLTLKPYKSGYKYDFWRLVPYLFRHSVTKLPEPDGKYGAIRVWPDYGSPEFPVVL